MTNRIRSIQDLDHLLPGDWIYSTSLDSLKYTLKEKKHALKVEYYDKYYGSNVIGDWSITGAFKVIDWNRIQYRGTPLSAESLWFHRKTFRHILIKDITEEGVVYTVLGYDYEYFVTIDKFYSTYIPERVPLYLFQEKTSGLML